MAEILRGVNLGGWLVLERWITPSLFSGLKAVDEYGLCLEAGLDRNRLLRTHRSDFITEDDLHWISDAGLNAIRIPVPHWVFGGQEPFVACIGRLDWAVETAVKTGLKVLLDIHTAPGSQNGYRHSGREGAISWHKDTKNITKILEVFEKLASRYKGAIWGIEPLNEPQPAIPKKLLEQFYDDCYFSLREISGGSCAFVHSDSFQPQLWQNFMSKDFSNVSMDCHFYQCFGPQFQAFSISEHLKYLKSQRSGQIEKLQAVKPVIVGEWSLGLPAKTLIGLDEKGRLLAKRDFAKTQLRVYGKTSGWFFWTYKTEQPGDWSYRHLVESGLMPAGF